MRKLWTPRAYLLALVVVAAAPCAAAGQARARVIEWDWKMPFRPTPVIKEATDEGRGAATYFVAVELVEVSVAGERVTVGSPFAAGDDWTRELKVRLKNVSGRHIAGAVLYLSFPEARPDGGVMASSLSYGAVKGRRRAVAPGEEFEVKRTRAEYERHRRWLAKVGDVTSVGRVALGLVIVTFEDGGMWLCQLQALDTQGGR